MNGGGNIVSQNSTPRLADVRRHPKLTLKKGVPSNHVSPRLRSCPMTAPTQRVGSEGRGPKLKSFGQAHMERTGESSSLS